MLRYFMRERCEIECLNGRSCRGERDGVYGKYAAVQERPHPEDDDSKQEPVYQDKEAELCGREADVPVV